MLTCWYVDMLTCWHVDMLTCWHVDMLTSWQEFRIITCLHFKSISNSKLRPTYSLTYSLTRVKSWDASASKNPHKLEKSSKPGLQVCATCATLLKIWTVCYCHSGLRLGALHTTASPFLQTQLLSQSPNNLLDILHDMFCFAYLSMITNKQPDPHTFWLVSVWLGDYYKSTSKAR